MKASNKTFLPSARKTWWFTPVHDFSFLQKKPHYLNFLTNMAIMQIFPLLNPFTTNSNDIRLVPHNGTLWRRGRHTLLQIQTFAQTENSADLLNSFFTGLVFVLPQRQKWTIHEPHCHTYVESAHLNRYQIESNLSVPLESKQ